jgi:hypothetical protein
MRLTIVAKNNLVRPLRSLSIVLAALMLCAGLVGTPTVASAGKALARLSAMNTAIDGKAIYLPSTSPALNSPAPPAAPGGIQFYSNTLKAPGDNVIYVTVSATGLNQDTCDGIALNCQVDGVPCVNGNGVPGSGTVAGIPNGWVIPLGDEYDCLGELGDTGFQFQFCAPLSKTKGNLHTITLNAASAFGYGDAYLEAVHVYVDANKITGKGNAQNACGTYATPNAADSPD